MKKIVSSLILILFFQASIFAAPSITVSGFPNNPFTPYNGVSTLTSSVVSSTPSIGGPILGPADSGTNIYSHTYNPSTGTGITHYIFRKNNLWYLAYWSYGSGGTQSGFLFVYNTYSTDIDPPCFASWEEVGSSPLNTYNVNISGICTSNTPGCGASFTAFADYLQLPLITTNDINAISPADKGMLTYDCTDKSLWLHDGTEWIMIQGSKKDIVVPQNAKVTFSNGFEIAEDNTNLKISSNLAQMVTLTPGFPGRLGFANSTPTSTVHLGGSNSHNVIRTSSNYTLSDQHRYVICTGSSAITITLPDASTCEGRIYTIKDYNSNIVQVSSISYIQASGPPVTSYTINDKAEFIAVSGLWYLL